jgi:hypothetical protein
MTSCAHPARSKSIDLENCGVVFLLPRFAFFLPCPHARVCGRAVPSLSPNIIAALSSRRPYKYRSGHRWCVSSLHQRVDDAEEMFSRAGSVKSGFDGLKQGPKVPSPHAGRQVQHRGWSSIGRRQSMQNAEMEGDAILFLVTTALKQPYLIKRKYCSNI